MSFPFFIYKKGGFWQDHHSAIKYAECDAEKPASVI
jgi:hypothetical protein